MKVSVVIPVYGDEETIAATVASQNLIHVSWKASLRLICSLSPAGRQPLHFLVFGPRRRSLVNRSESLLSPDELVFAP